MSSINNVDFINLGSPTSSIHLPALKYISGERIWYAVTIPYKTLGKFIQTSALKKKNQAIIKSEIKNRFLDRKHKEEIINYIKAEREFTIPPITLVSYEKLDFRAYSFGGIETNEEEILENVGSLAGVIVLPIDYEFECLDGNHRTAAIRDLANTDPEYIAGSNMLLNIVHDNRPKKIRQDFVDVNKNAKPTTSSINTLFNTRDSLSNIVVDLIEETTYLKETTELLSTSVSKNSKDLYTINNIKNAVTEILGFNSQSVKSEKVSAKLKIDPEFINIAKERSRSFFNVLKQNEYIAKCLDERDQTPDIRSRTLIITGTGIIIISRIASYIFSAFDEQAQPKEFNRLINIDWSRANPLFAGKVIVDGQKILNSRDSISSAVVAVKIELGYELTKTEQEFTQKTQLL